MASLDSIIKGLQAKDKLFVKALDASGRHWFTSRIAMHVQTQPDVEAAATAALERARDLAQPRLSAAKGTTLKDDLKRPKENELRARIIYGLIGLRPDVFVDGPGQAELLDFLIARRFRALQRMLSYVNPNDSRGIFGYPKSVLAAQVNVQSQKLWEGINGNHDTYPFRLSTDGQAKPQEAIEKLFTVNKKKKDRTLVDCPAATMIVHMDALLAAHDPKKLAEKLAAAGPEYLHIDHPYGPLFLFTIGLLGGYGGFLTAAAGPGSHVELKMLVGTTPDPAIIMDKDGKQDVDIEDVVRDPTLVAQSQVPKTDAQSSPLQVVTVKVKSLSRSYSVGAHLAQRSVDWFHVVTDDRPDKALFERSFIEVDDLMAGDHVWLANHPIHRTRVGKTPWNGEHSFLLETWTTKPKMRVIGHGAGEQTVLELTNKMLDEINVFLDVSRAVLDAWLAMSASKKAAKVFSGKAGADLQLLLAQHLLRSDSVPFDGKARIFNMPALTYKRGGKTKSYPGYWVMDLEGDDNGPPKVTIGRKDAVLFDYDPRADSARLWKTPWKPANPIALLRHDNLVGLSSKEKHHYAVTYLDDFLGLAFFLPLYHPIGSKKGDPMRVTFDDVKSSIFFGSSDGKVFTVRPRLAADSTYLSYLTSIGATP